MGCGALALSWQWRPTRAPEAGSFEGQYREIVNTDAKEFGGSSQGNMGAVEAITVPHHGRPFSLNVTLPPLAAVFHERED
jgi:1,4-alpha-glucan branching enzyme